MTTIVQPLTEEYVRKKITQRLGIPYKEVDFEMVSQYRLILELKRSVRLNKEKIVKRKDAIEKRRKTIQTKKIDNEFREMRNIVYEQVENGLLPGALNGLTETEKMDYWFWKAAKIIKNLNTKNLTK